MKKTLSLLLALLMLLGTVSALAEYPISQEPLTLRVFQWVVENQQVDFENLWFFQELEKKTNIKIEWETVKDGDWKTKLTTMLASGDWPDLIIRGGVSKDMIEDYGVSQGILLPLDDYLAENMPNYTSRLGLNNANAAIPSSDGKTYFIGNLTAQNINHDGTFFINKVWLEKLGLEVPTTVDELTEVLRAFRDGDPNGNGLKDEIPFSGADLIHQTQGVYNHFAMFGVPLQRFVYAAINDEGQVVFPGYMDGFRTAVEWLNLCYTEGLLDPEAMTQDSNAWGTKVNADQVGFTTYLRTINTAMEQAAIAPQFQHILPPASEFGVKVPRILEIPEFGAAITSTNKHVAESLRWLDAQMETETMLISVNGPMAGGPLDPAPLGKTEDGKYKVEFVPADNGLYQYVPVIHGQFFAPGDYYFDIFEMPPHRVERKNQAALYEEAGVLEKNSFYYLTRLASMDTDTAVEVGRLFAEIEKFMKESITNFITQGVTDQSWQAFLDNARNIGVDQYIAYYQAAYDAYLAANQ